MMSHVPLHLMLTDSILTLSFFIMMAVGGPRRTLAAIGLIGSLIHFGANICSHAFGDSRAFLGLDLYGETLMALWGIGVLCQIVAKDKGRYAQ
jgi:hypothetical protein